MSVLGVFDILFQSNADKVKQGQDEATLSGKKLETELGKVGESGAHAAHEIEESNSRLAESFDVVKEHAGEMATRLVEHAMEVAAAFQALFAVEKLVDNFFETAEQSDQLGERAKSIGVETELLDAWGNATKRVGGSAEAFGASILHVNTQMERMSITGKSRILPFFKALGVDAIDPVTHKAKALFDLLPQLAKATEGKSKQETTASLRGIGFDEGTIRLLQRGGKEVDELLARQKKLGLVTAEDAEAAEKFNIEWDDVKQLFHSITVAFDTEVLPLLEDLLDAVEGIVEFLRDHKSFVGAFFTAVAVGAFLAADALGVFGAIASIVFSPITLIIAGILALAAAFAFVYDDMMNFAEGNASVIGELSKTWPIIGTIARFIITEISALWAICKTAFFDIIAWIKRIPEGFRQWSEIFDTVITLIENFVNRFLNSLFHLIPGSAKHLDALKTVFSNAMLILSHSVATQIRVIKAVFSGFWEATKAVFFLLADLVVNPLHAFENFATRMKGIFKAIVLEFPSLTIAFQSVSSEFEVIANAIIALWHGIETVIGGTIGRIGSAWNGLKGGLTFGGTTWWGSGLRNTLPTWLGGASAAPDLPAAHTALASTASPLMSQTSASIAAAGAANSNHNSTVITVGPTTINAANDPDAIQKQFDKHMESHVTNAANQFASGNTH